MVSFIIEVTFKRIAKNNSREAVTRLQSFKCKALTIGLFIALSLIASNLNHSHWQNRGGLALSLVSCDITWTSEVPEVSTSFFYYRKTWGIANEYEDNFY